MRYKSIPPMAHFLKGIYIMASAKTNNKAPTQEKQEAPIPVLVVVTKNGESCTMADAAGVRVRTVEELGASGETMLAFCLNLLAGNVADEIIAAHHKRGGLSRLLPNWAKADLNALRRILDAVPSARRGAWALHIERTKRVRGISLQAISKALAPAGTPRGATLKEAMTAWVKNNPQVVLPVSLHDLLVEHEVLAS
jgi:hypothetical protein